MKLRFLKDAVTSDGRRHKAGDITEIVSELAGDLIRRGVAKAVNEEEAAEEEKPEEEEESV